MDASDLLAELVQQTGELVNQAAHPQRRTLRVSPEVAAFYSAAFEYPEAGPIAEAPAAATEETPSYHTAPEPRDVSRIETLEELERVVSACTKCDLCKTRTRTVFSDGSACARLVFVGEAPGADEDRQGKPFVGRAGQLLTDIIVKGMKLRREDVYICNVLKCRPPNNRDPLLSEKEQCRPYLDRQLELLKPKVICALGRHAANTLLCNDESTGRLRGRWHFYRGIPVRVTYHPAYLLRNEADKRLAWDDVQHVMRALSGEEDPFAQPPAPGEGSGLFS